MVMIWYQVVLCVPATLVLLLITLHSRGKKICMYLITCANTPPFSKLLLVEGAFI